MFWNRSTQAIAFADHRAIGPASLETIAGQVWAIEVSDPPVRLHIFDAATSERIELDLRGSRDDVLERLPPLPEEAIPGITAGPGRPKLGVVPREITLLPRHWEWLNRQPGGASVALRKLVDEARKASETKDRLREARESTYRFLSVMAGDLPGFEEASRALFAIDRTRFEEIVAPWPPDIRDHALRLALPSFAVENIAGEV